MDFVAPVVLLVLTLVYSPGNADINAYCKTAVEEFEEFTSQKECWDYYKDYRDGIPEGEWGV